MDRSRLNILQVSTFDAYGGAEKVAWDLFQEYLARGHGSWLAVGRKRTSHPRVLRLENDSAPGAWRRFWWRAHDRSQRFYGRWWGTRLCRMTHRLAEPVGALDAFRGLEDFHYPGTRRLPEMTPERPNIVHGHNLHARYFDLRVLPWLSRQVPVVLTLHDAWLTTGHCAHSFDCVRWQTGCGRCPDLRIYPAIRRDATAANWRRKRDIYAASRLYVATPCRWLMDRVGRSMLAPAIVESRVIPYGVDVSVFRVADRAAARADLGIPPHSDVLLFAASGVRTNLWKDYDTMRGALVRLAERSGGRPLLLLALGEAAPAERVGRAEIRFVPYQSDPEVVARHYQAADVYVHAARVDTFPNTVLEALACGVPVVATAVGGIPEQVKSLPPPGRRSLGLRSIHGPADATGILVPCGDTESMAAAVDQLLSDAGLRRRLAESAAADARHRFSLDREADDYLAWYYRLLGTGSADGAAPGRRVTAGAPA
ncbi:MAG: glycosyltransferase [Phycisphaerales bacterium]|nr:MAG: glycosyltransferase [Phycisphaerales bacterium]